MPSTISKKTTKGTAYSSGRTKRASKGPPKIVTMRPSKGTLTAAEFDAIAVKHGARPLTAEERKQFRRFAKDPYP